MWYYSEMISEAKKPKILYIITKSNWGGAQQYVYDFATNLDKNRYDIAVAFGEGGTLKTKLNESGIRTIQIPFLERDINIIKEIRSFFFLVSLFVKEKPDIIHLNSSKIGALGAFAGRLTGVKRIIFTAHAWAFTEDRAIASRGAILFLHWLTVLFTHKTIAVSEKTKKELVWMPFVAHKIEVIHNGIAPIHFLDRGSAKKILGIDEEPLWIGTISELHQNKGLDFLIAAIVELKKDPQPLPPFKVMIISDGEEKKNLEELIAKNSLTESVFLKGYVADAKIYLKAFDICTLTSRKEGFPYFVLEAGQAEVPLLASAVGGIPEAVHQLESGILVKTGNIKEIRDGLKILILEKDRRTSLASALKKEVEKSFTLDKMISETEKLYK